MKILLILAFPTILFGQFGDKYLSIEKGSHLFLSAASGILSGYADHYDVMKAGATSTKYDKLYHNFQAAERVSFLAMGVSIPITSKFKVLPAISDILLSMTYQGIFHNLGQNLARNKPIFWQSDYQKVNNTSGFEQFASPLWQISAFVFVTFLNWAVYHFFGD